MATSKQMDDEDESENSNESNPFSFKMFLNKTSSLDTIQRNAESKLTESNPLSFKNFINKNETEKFHPPPPPPSPPILRPPPLPSPPTIPKSTGSSLQLPDFVNESLINDDFISPGGDLANNENPYIFLENAPKSVAVNKSNLYDQDEEFKSSKPSYFDLETKLNDNFDSDNLKKKLKDKQQIISEQSTYIKQLEKTIKDLKKKEDTENKALEAIIQQVEENLVKTTERAVESERNADKLKQEIKQLKIQVLNLTGENQLLKNAHTNGDLVKLAHFSNQINNAASQAETSLKQLLSGVETLKLIAANIESFDKIREISAENKQPTN